MAEKEEKIISAKRINVIVQELKGLVSEQLLTKPILQNKLGIANWALEPTKPTYDKHAVGLGNVENTAFYRRNCIVNGQQYAMSGTVNSEGFSIYAPTNHGGQDGLILTSKLGTTPEWKAPSSITVGKATQLANTRKIWGQNFNGTGNVDGDLTANGSIRAIGGGVGAQGVADFDVEHTEKTTTITSLLPSGMIPDSTGIRLLKQGGRVTIQGRFTYTYGTSTSSVRMFTIPDEFMPNANVNASWQVASGNIMWGCGINKSTKALYLFGIINPITGATTDTTSRTYSINFTYII